MHLVFLKKQEYGISGESKSRFHDLEKVGPIETAVTSFGQRFDITPLQLITAVSAIANDRIFNSAKNSKNNIKHRYRSCNRYRIKRSKKSNFSRNCKRT